MKRLFSAAALSILLLAGCEDEPTLDTSSDDALKESVKSVSADLSPDESKELAQTLLYVMMRGAFQSESSDGIEALDGMTAREAIAYVANAKAKSSADGHAKASAEIEALQLEREEAMALIRPVKVGNATYEWYDGDFDAIMPSYLFGGPHVSYTVTNGGDVALGGIYMRVTVASPGRSKAWVVEDSLHSIVGGLGPGETREFQNIFGTNSVAWKKLGIFGKNDLEVTVEVIGIETVEQDQNDNKYHGSNIARIDKRLHELRTQVSKLEDSTS